MTETTKTHVILLSCGSFNPITKGHIQMFDSPLRCGRSMQSVQSSTKADTGGSSQCAEPVQQASPLPAPSLQLA
ncbi:Nicotinamide mononucleotide adenylyltransferase 2 [Chelonia mydas]|uniref:Nicotinamide mononucleotide adenylyltransferase 2 n=1 Tax=Chelonia mydas TaxID=8469 RepID=M7BBB1_CHEMY|nr:Nicotinamide mononucleotide adenylyltransferase 2 [Chelonia mydas]